MINYPEEIMLVRASATFLHMVLSDNTDNEMRSSMVTSISIIKSAPDVNSEVTSEAIPLLQGCVPSAEVQAPLSTDD